MGKRKEEKEILREGGVERGTGRKLQRVLSFIASGDVPGIESSSREFEKPTTRESSSRKQP